MAEGEQATYPRIPVEMLRQFATRAFVRAGMPDEDARTTATILTNSDTWGIESHGMPLLRGYVTRCMNGLINVHPTIRTVSEYPGTAVLDGDDGAGPVVGAYAMRMAIEKARETGTATVTVRNSNHYGACFNYPMMAVAAGMAGMTMTSTGPAVVPTFGLAPLLGTNPICIAFPGGDTGRPFVIDMATSVVALGKVGVYRRAGKPLPDGWAYDADMHPTTDAQTARYLNPLGCDRDHGSQKGYGLNVAVDLFTGLLSGGRYSAQMAQATAVQSPLKSAHLFSAWRVDAFVPLDEYRARFDEYTQMLRDCPPAPGAPRVFVPGEPEWEAEADRRAHGVPLNPLVVEELQKLAAELDIPLNPDRSREGEQGVRMPPNFTWLREGIVAGSGRPRSPDDLHALRAAGVGAIITLTEEPLPAAWLADAGLLALHLPVVDFTAPTLAQIAAAMEAMDDFHRENRPVVIHCAGGRGRTGTMLACALVRDGEEADAAIAAVRAARPGSIETPEQVAIVGVYARQMKETNP